MFKVNKKYKLPSFLIIGAMKAGTTSLYYALTKHSCIQSAITKELHFFNTKWRRMDSYKYKFKPCYDYQITGEASPSYIFSDIAPYQAKQIIPDVKIIALLRNPITRSYSQFQGYLRKCAQRNQRPLSKYFGKFLKKLEANPKKNNTLNSIGRDLLEYSLYKSQLERWYECFPEQNIKIIKSEDFFKNPRMVINHLFKWFGLEVEPVKFAHYLRAKKQNNKHLNYVVPPLTKSVINKLTKYFKPFNAELYEFLGRDMNWEEEI